MNMKSVADCLSSGPWKIWPLMEYFMKLIWTNQR